MNANNALNSDDAKKEQQRQKNGALTSKKLNICGMQLDKYLHVYTTMLRVTKMQIIILIETDIKDEKAVCRES